MKYFIIAGEKSGDLHGSNLIKEIKLVDNNAQFHFFGGEQMQAEDNNLLMHYKNLDIIGVKGVILNFGKIFKNMNFCKSEILKFNPAAVILIDYPGFNLRIAKFATKNNYKVFYFISPQVWAWKKSRVKIIKKYVYKLFSILPFEKEFYQKYNYNVEFVGHPLAEIIEKYPKKEFKTFCEENNLSDKKIIALLPGSRTSEINSILPVIIEISNYFPDYQFVVAAISARNGDLYKKYSENKNVKIIFDKTYSLLQNAYAAVVASGTATLETGLFGVPLIVCYKIDNLSYFLAKKLIKIKYISLVNIILDKPAVKELIQHDLNITDLRAELQRITENQNYRLEILSNLENLKAKLKVNENSYKKTVNMIISSIND